MVSAVLSCAFRDFFSEHFTLEKRVDSMSICIPSVRAREERRGTERRDGEVAPLARLASLPVKRYLVRSSRTCASTSRRVALWWRTTSCSTVACSTTSSGDGTSGRQEKEARGKHLSFRAALRAPDSSPEVRHRRGHFVEHVDEVLKQMPVAPNLPNDIMNISKEVAWIPKAPGPTDPHALAAIL